MSDVTSDEAVRQAVQGQRAREVFGRYAVACDGGDEAALAALFHPDAKAVYVEGSELTGSAEIAAWVIGAMAHLVWQQHGLTAMTADVDGDRATAVAYLTATQVAADTPDTAMVMNCRYDAELELVAGDWLIRRLHFGVGTIEQRPVQLGSLAATARTAGQHA